MASSLTADTVFMSGVFAHHLPELNLYTTIQMYCCFIRWSVHTPEEVLCISLVLCLAWLQPAHHHLSTSVEPLVWPLMSCIYHCHLIVHNSKLGMGHHEILRMHPITTLILEPPYHTGNYKKLTDHLNPVKILNLQKYLQLANILYN